MHSRALVLLLVLPVALAGCARPSESADDGPNDTIPTSTPPPPTGPPVRFVVEGLTIRPGIGDARGLYEDDGEAIIRYVVRQPADAGATETAFVTYTLNGRISDVENLRLDPGQEKAYERRVEDLRQTRDIRVEVRAGSSMATASAQVVEWPRAGEGLQLGNLTLRMDHGLAAYGTKILVNLSIAHAASDEALSDFRVKMICADPQGKLFPTTSVRMEPPTPGNATGVDVYLDDCPHLRYAIEVKAEGTNKRPLYGRIALVERGWTP